LLKPSRKITRSAHLAFSNPTTAGAKEKKSGGDNAI